MVLRNGTAIENATVLTDNDGRFEYEMLPSDNSVVCAAVSNRIFIGALYLCLASMPYLCSFTSVLMSVAGKKFVGDWIRRNLTGTVLQIAVHPGKNATGDASDTGRLTWQENDFSIGYDEILDMVPGKEKETEYRLTNNGKDALVNCHVDVLFPRDKIQVSKYEKVITFVKNEYSYVKYMN